jgi:hypothetical protein
MAFLQTILKMKQPLTIIILFAINSYLFAGTYISGNISYTHITGNKYGIFIKTLTTISATDSCYVRVFFGDGTDELIPRINGASPVFCLPPSRDGLLTTYGRYSIYYTEHTYPASGYYTVSTQLLSYTNSIVNITNSTSVSPILTSEIVNDSLLGYNSSVSYGNGLGLMWDTVNTPSGYYPDFINTDTDSLYFELIPANGIYTFPANSNSFSIDNYTGIITWDNPITIGQYNFSYKISEWRKISGVNYYMGNSMQEVWADITNPTFISEQQNIQQLTLFPNPTTANLNITINTSQKENVIFSIYNITGQLVYESKPELYKGINTFKINTINYNDGLYFFRINGEQINFCKKFIKQ